MDGSSGTIRLEEKGSPVKNSPSEPLTPVSVSDLCGECPQKSPSSVCMPICFLVREQAKSLVAIQDLQKRMKHLEGAQNEVISAISESHRLVTSSDCNENLSLSPRNPALGLSPGDRRHSLSISPLRNKQSNSKFGLSISLSPNTNNNASWKSNFTKSLSPCEVETQQQKSKHIQAKDSAPDSDKQDSGLDSDCREQGLESNVPQIEITPSLRKYSSSALVQNNPDELLDLLDEIGQKSEILRQHLSSDEHQVPVPQLSEEMTKLHHEHLELHRLLCDIKGERDDLNSKIVDLETTTDELASKNKHLHQNFMTLLVEKHKLEAKLHNFSTTSGKSSNSSNDLSNSNCVAGLPFSKNVRKIDTTIVSAVLKETNPLDLQKQVLAYMMENEMLRSKLDQIEEWYASKELEKECFEKVAKDEIRELMSENERLRIALEEQKLETAASKSKVRMLERVLQSVTLENRELNLQLGESFLFREALCQPSRLTGERFSSTSISSSNGTPRRLSLPAQNKNEQDVTVSCAKTKLSPNTSSFIDVTIEDPESSESELAMMLDSTFNVGQHRASTPLSLAKKQHLKFSEMMKASSVRFTSNKPQQTALRKSAGKKLNFSSYKPNQGNSIPTFREFTRNASLAEAANNCDKLSRTSNYCGNKPLDMIEEKSNDPKTFPFYSILEKLKANPECKFPDKYKETCEDAGSNENMAAGTQTPNGSYKTPPSGLKCNSLSNVTRDGHPGHTKEHRLGSAHSKNIHKRIQDILDRITSESEEAVV